MSFGPSRTRLDVSCLLPTAPCARSRITIQCWQITNRCFPQRAKVNGWTFTLFFLPSPPTWHLLGENDHLGNNREILKRAVICQRWGDWEAACCSVLRFWCFCIKMYSNYWSVPFKRKKKFFNLMVQSEASALTKVTDDNIITKFTHKVPTFI